MMKPRTDAPFTSRQLRIGQLLRGKSSLAKLTCIVLAFCAATVTGSPAQTYTTIFNFNGLNAGYGPGSLVEGLNGNFYGTTGLDGTYGVGNVFEISAAGQQKTLYSFCSQPNCADGQYPAPGLVQATNGFLYGTTQEGGANNSGTIFQITPSAS
jgi:uncharacterized repeat protein (TIGR03803 family)